MSNTQARKQRRSYEKFLKKLAGWKLKTAMVAKSP